MYQYNAVIDKVIDGDTFDATIDLGFSTLKKERLRLKGVDTPELRTSNKREKNAAILVTEFVKHLLKDRTLVIETNKKGGFGRYIADIYLPQGGTLSNYLLKRGLAREYKARAPEWTEEQLAHIFNELNFIEIGD
jgi:micrococcal nuclease